MLAWQLLVGVLVAGAAWGLTGKFSVGWSALYGALAVVEVGLILKTIKKGPFAEIDLFGLDLAPATPEPTDGPDNPAPTPAAA